jgi:hypothetical protein
MAKRLKSSVLTRSNRSSAKREATTSVTQRTTDQALDWYKTHKTASALGFDPDGMCLKVVRSARNILPKYPSALSAQLATPEQYRVFSLNDVRRGMIGYFDEPDDENPFGHVITFLGRDEDKFLLTWTNGVKENALAIVYASYFIRNWGDRFQFAATWLNGVELLGFQKAEPKPDPMPEPVRVLRNLRHAIEDLRDMIRVHRRKGHMRLVHALERDLTKLQETLKEFE